MAMRCEEPSTMFPELRPDLFAIGLRKLQRIQLRAGEELESPFTMGRRSDYESPLDFKEEHQPVRLPVVTVLAHEPGQMQLGRRNVQSHFLMRFATGARIRRFTDVGMELPSTWAPQAAIRFLCSFEQQHLVALVKHIEQGRNLVRQRHARSESGLAQSGKRAARISSPPATACRWGCCFSPFSR